MNSSPHDNRGAPQVRVGGEALAGSKSTAMPKRKRNFLVVGIGASAGGVTALEQFFDGLPREKKGIAYVVVLHLSPEYESNLGSVIQNHTSMRVTQVTRRVKVVPDTVYVIPPRKQLSMSDGHIILSDIEGARGRRVPIDLFFRTLAESHREWSAAVVLSGMGSDGSLGVVRIKEVGGITIVQDPAGAEHDQMPKSAIATGFADYVLSASTMGERLARYRDNLVKIGLPQPPEESNPEAEEAVAVAQQSHPAPTARIDNLQEILALLRARTGHNFASYKRSTLLRRIERRMQVNDVHNLADYLAYMRANAAEVPLLLRDLLISVTNFFRDKEVWEVLETTVVPLLFKHKNLPDSSVRVWVAGCATGEEAYSIAILLHEYAATLPDPPKLQIFATDLDERANAVAREGSYPETISIDVSAERLRKFFTHTGRRYRVSREIRESVLFAGHDLLTDPPFSRVDLVSCRNLLIYMNRDAQDQLLSLFHFALSPNSYLLLGLAETADGVQQLYNNVDKEHHIYMRRSVPRYVQPLPSMQRHDGRAGLPRPSGLSEATKDQVLVPADVHQNMLERYAPPSVVVDENYDIVHVSSNAGRYLQVAGGEPTHNLLRLVLPDLRLDLRSALYKAQRGIASESRRVTLRLDGTERLVRLLVRPVDEPDALRGYSLVMFDEIAESDDLAARRDGLADSQAYEDDGKAARQISEPFVRQLEEEAMELRSELRVTVEQYETTVEELKASNEELQAINEELRSTTEALETSKEEMQAVNEELLTVNQELKIKVDEVSRANNDLQNLMTSTQIATIFLDRQMYVKRYTPAVEKLFNIIPTDTDRPISHLTHKLQYPQLLEDAEEVMRDLRPRERELRSTSGDWYIVRLLPYRTVEDRIEGVVITFVEITERKRAEEALLDREERYRSLFDSIDEAFTIVEMTTAADGKDVDFRFIEANRAFEHQFEVPGAVGKTMREAISNIEQRWIENYATVIRTGEPVRFQDHVAALDRWFSVFATRIGGPDSRRVAVVFADITEIKRAQEQLELRIHERTTALTGANTELQSQISAREQAEDEVRNTNVRLRDLSNRLLAVQEEERRNIARELHDQIGQYLTGLRLILEGLKSQPARATGRGVEAGALVPELTKALSTLDELTESVRELSLNLRPPVLDDLGLLPALIWHIERYCTQTGINVDFRHSGLEGRLPSEVETAVYRVVQEALTNVARHSGAKDVTLQIVRDDQITVFLEDRGNGFDLDKALATHTSTGISAMRERIDLLGGHLTIESQPGHGTRLMAEIPLTELIVEG